MYTRQDLPPSYSGSLFRAEEGVGADACTEEAAENPRQTEDTAQQRSHEEAAIGLSAEAAPAAARPRSAGTGNFLSKLGLGRFLKLDLEDLVILALAVLLLLEDGDGDLLPILLILLLTDR